MPELPTVAETGLPGFDAASWNGIMVPAWTPRPIINRLHDAIVNVVTQPEMKSFLATQDAEPATLGPDEFREFIRVELAEWGKVVKSAGVTDESWRA